MGQIRLFNEDQLTNGTLVVVWMGFHRTNNAENEKYYLTPLILPLRLPLDRNSLHVNQMDTSCRRMTLVGDISYME